MSLFGSKELLSCVSLSSLYGIIALKLNWWWVGNQTSGITPAHVYSPPPGAGMNHTEARPLCAGIYVSGSHDSFTNCDHNRECTDGIVSLADVFSPSGKFCIIWKSAPSPATHHISSLTFSLISNVNYTNNIYVLYFVSFVYKIVFYMLLPWTQWEEKIMWKNSSTEEFKPAIKRNKLLLPRKYGSLVVLYILQNTFNKFFVFLQKLFLSIK